MVRISPTAVILPDMILRLQYILMLEGVNYSHPVPKCGKWTEVASVEEHSVMVHRSISSPATDVPGQTKWVT